MDYWHLKNKELFNSLKRDIDENYPTLVVLILDNIVHIKGTVRIKDDKGVVLDSFEIDIRVPQNYPQEIPEVRETKNRIPLTPDRHFGQDGKACLCFRDEVFLYWGEKSTILNFIKIFVEPFFLWQIEYEVSGGKNKDKAYSHSFGGALEFYKKILKTEDVRVIYKFVEYLTKKKVKGHWNCFCGSGKKIRDCHFELMKEYKNKIRAKDAKITLEEFNKIIATRAQQK